MPDNRLTLTIEAQNLAQAAFKQLQADVRRSNDALQKTGQVGQRVGAGIKVLRDELGRAAQATLQAGRNVARLTDQFVGLYRSSGAVRQLGRDFRFLQNNIQATSGVVQQFTRNLTAQTQAIVEQAARVERLKLGLETLSPSIQEAEAQYRSLIEVARLPGIDFSNALQANLQLQAIGESGEEATRRLKAFGNALALGGASTADIQRVIYGLRQLIADGVVLQRELNLITARVPVSIPILREQFGGVRAEDIREHFESIGVSRSDQASEFIRILTEELEKLPSASETAANAIENLGDTFRRAQASVGEGLLPVVKETIAALEGLLLSVEKDEGLKTATADWLAFATAMGTVTAGVVGVAAVIPLLGGLANPIGLTALAVGALAGAFVKAEVAAARLRAEYSRTQAALESGLRVGQGENTEAIEKEIDRLEARRTFLQNRIASLREEVEAERSPTAALATTHLQDESLRVSTERQTDAILEQNDAYKTYQSQLFQVDKAIEVLTRRTDKLNESQQDAADTATDSLTRAFKSLTDAAAGTDAQIAEALQRFENTTAGADTQVTDLARDIGSQLVSIAEATSVAQIEASKKRVDALARDNSLILEDSKALQALLLAVEESFAARRKELRQDQFTLEVHDEGAQALTDALLQFYDLQSTIQEAVKLDAKESAEGQATAYIKAYRDSIDPAILHLVETVKILRAEVRGSIQDLEQLQAQDTFRLEVHGEVGAEQRDALAELFDLQQSVQGDLTRNQIDNLNKRAEALKATLADETLSLQSYVADATAIQEQLRDKSLELLGDVVQARQASFEDDARAQRQVEDAKQRKAAETHDFHAYLNGLRRKSVQEATAELARLEERALDASNQRHRENLIRETQQFVDAYAERGEAFRALVTDAQDLGADLQAAFDLTEQQERIEDFQASLAGVLQDLAGITIDHIWQSFTDGAQSASDAVADFTTRAGDALRLLESDILRLQRFNEDSDIRGERLQEDRDRRIRQLQRQRQALAARAPAGDQRAIEQNIQRQQDINFQIARLREDFGVRISRQQEDTERRRSRLIEDATSRRERFEARGTDEGLLSKLADSLASSVSSAVSSAIAQSLADYLTKSAFDAGVGLITAALGGLGIGSITDALKNLFGGGKEKSQTTTETQSGAQDTDTTTATGDADVDGTIKTLTVDPNITKPTVDVTGTIISAMQAASEAYTTPTIDAIGRITSAELSEGATLPSVPGLKGGVANVVLQQNAQLPIVPGLSASISSLVFDEDIDAPSIPAYEAIISDIKFAEGVAPPALSDYAGAIASLSFVEGITIPSLPSYSAVIESISFAEGLDFPSLPSFAGVIGRLAFAEGVSAPSLPNYDAIINSVKFAADIDLPDLASYEASIASLKLAAGIALPTVSGLAGQIDSVALAPDIDLPTLRIPATAVVGPVTGRQTGGQFRGTDTDEDPENPMLDGGGLEGLINSLSIDTAALDAIQPVQIAGVINASLNKLFDEPIVLQGRIDATVNYLTGANIDQTEGSRGTAGKDAEDPIQRSQVAQDLSTIARVLEGAAVSGNLNPELGPTPRVDISTPNLDVDNQPVPGAAHPQGFGDTLGNTDQFAPRAGGGGRAGVSGAIRVTFPTEVLSKLAQEDTLSKQLVGVNQHLAVMRTFIANDMFPALNTQLTAIAQHTQALTEIPLVEALALPGAPALEDVPVGLQDTSIQLLDALQRFSESTGPTPNLADIPGSSEGNPMYMHMVNQRDVQDVRLVGGKIESVGSVGEIKKQVNVKHVGSLAVTQGGEIVVQIAGGGALPVRVEGGRMTVDIGGGLEGLAVQLADTEVGLEAVGAI